ncbi:cytochrome P450 [Nocardia terpenica]|uniref:cytochrome P450 family protein n=1 Tax=Nocardia terpenica TaxID=455432 RepID=UPI002FE3307A
MVETEAVQPAAVQPIEKLGDDFHADPHRYYDRWRESGPVHHVQLTDGVPCWVVIGYGEGRAALADPRLRKNYNAVYELFRRKIPGGIGNEDAQVLAAHMLNSDPPDHTRLRKLVSKEFTSRRVAAMRPRIEEITAALLDDVAAHEEPDLLQRFAIPLPVTVICELLGVPFEDRASFQAWTKIVLGGTTGTVEDRSAASLAMSNYLQELVEAKRARPGEDLLSGLVQTSEDGDRLGRAELVAMAFLLLVAGHETTVNLIGNGVYHLLRHRDQFRALREDPDGIPAAVEEFLRYDGPVGWSTVRYTAEPVRIGGVDIPADEIVYISLGAANRDRARFQNADRLDVTANANGHLAFGHGIHFCVGAPLARLEADVAFRSLLARFPNLDLADRAFTPEYQVGMLIRGLTELPVRPNGL